VVLDPFHAIKLGQNTIDAVRRRVQQDTLGHRGRRGDPLYGIRRVLLRGAERHTLKSYTHLLTGLAAGDHVGQVSAAWIATQELRHVYGARTLAQARDRLFTFYTVCADAGIPELQRLARTISAWQDQLLAYFHTGRASNGPTEAVNLLIKRIKRVGFGFRNFRQLPATPTPALRHHLEHSPHNTNQGTLTTPGVVEPVNPTRAPFALPAATLAGAAALLALVPVSAPEGRAARGRAVTNSPYSTRGRTSVQRGDHQRIPGLLDRKSVHGAVAAHDRNSASRGLTLGHLPRHLLLRFCLRPGERHPVTSAIAG